MSRLLRSTIALGGLLAVLAAGCAPAPAPVVTTEPTGATRADLSGLKTYLLGKIGELKTSTARLKSASDRYYELAHDADFDYAALWQANPEEAKQAIDDARAAWTIASPLYEQTEGIVAGVPSLAEYDVILDAGASGAEDSENTVPFDLTLADGRVLEKPGNLFGVTESALWGTFPEFTAQGVEPDFDGDGLVEFGEALPDANVLKAAADEMVRVVGDLDSSAQAWQPTESDAFTALVVMVPTMSEYFESWKNSRFILGEGSTQRDFVAISRLSDIQDILGSLQVVYANVDPMVQTVDSAQGNQIGQSLDELKAFVGDVYAQEQGGKRFTPEEADLLGAEAQNRATALTGQISQVAAQLGIALAE